MRKDIFKSLESFIKDVDISNIIPEHLVRVNVSFDFKDQDIHSPKNIDEVVKMESPLLEKEKM